MRYAQIISEKIANKPYFVQNYVKSTILKLKTIANTFETASAEAKKNDGAESLCMQLLRYGSGDPDASAGIYQLAYVPSYERQAIENLVHSLQAYLDHGNRFLQYIITSLEHMKPERRYDDVIAILPTFEKGVLDYGYDPADDTSLDEDYFEAKRYIEALRKIAKARQDLSHILADLATKMGVLQDRYVAAATQTSYRPKHEEIETLYHASAFVPEILKNGFDAEKPDERLGLGNFGVVKDTVSFTHDLEVARNIMRTLKEVCMIAHGALTSRTILAWIRKEKLKADSLMHGAGIDPTKLKNTPEEAVVLYRYWIALTSLRSDPVMTNPESIVAVMKTRKVSDIGILACEVKIDQKDEYLVGEAEFRIPPSQIISAKRIL